MWMSPLPIYHRYATGLSYWLSLLMDKATATLAGAGFVLVTNLFINGLSLASTPRTDGLAYRFNTGAVAYVYGMRGIQIFEY